jgi:hypothetical protein
MKLLSQVVVLSALVSAVMSAAQVNQPGDFGAEERAESERFTAVIEELCKNRPGNEYFRLSTESNCRDAVRCVGNDFQGGHTLSAVRCPTGLVFDLDQQTCDWSAKVRKTDGKASFLSI